VGDPKRPSRATSESNWSVVRKITEAFGRKNGVNQKLRPQRTATFLISSRNFSQLGIRGVKFVRIGSCELVSLGAVV